MRVKRTIATGLLLGWMCQNTMAGQPTFVERPSPPPCCADGQCFASPMTYGYYDTRWRRWPLETMAQAATGKPAALPAAIRQDVEPFVRPQPDLEDRKAPPPSVPAGQQTPAGGPSGASRAPGAPGAPSGPASLPGAKPATSGPGLPTPPPPSTTPAPAGQGTQPNTAPLYKNVSPDSPLNRTPPQGDADPPPALPFGPALVAPEPPTLDISQEPAPFPDQSPGIKPVVAPSSDPPPALPVVLADFEE